MRTRGANHTGVKFGKLLCISKTRTSTNRPAYVCLCSCGEEVVVRRTALVRGEKTHCGCERKLDFTGQKHQMLTLLKRTSRGGMHAYLCQCDCGNTNTIRWNAIQQGQLSCGCKSTIDYTGRRFGKLLALKKLGTSTGHKYLCQCDCGTQLEITYNNLHGSTRSCGCVRPASCVLREEVKRKARPQGYSLKNAVWSYYVRNAGTRDLDWGLTKDQFFKLIDAPCHYCARVGVTHTKNSTDQIWNNGVDRVDNSKGYTTKNSVTCCKTCNQAKNSLSMDEFKEWAKAFVKNHKNWR